MSVTAARGFAASGVEQEAGLGRGQGDRAWAMLGTWRRFDRRSQQDSPVVDLEPRGVSHCPPENAERPVEEARVDGFA